MADVVLPAACWAEKEGTFTKSERKVQRVRKAAEPPPEARPDWMILSEIGRRLGISMNFSSAEDVFYEMHALTPSYLGIRYERSGKRDLQWPCTSVDHEGPGFHHQGRFTRGLGMFNAIDYRPSEELPDDKYPFILTTGRRYVHYHTRTMTGRCPSLDKEMPQPIAQINERDAVKLGLKAGEAARVVSRRGEGTTFVRPGDIVPEGAIFMDFHFAEANGNVLLGTSLDPVSKTPD